MLADTARVTNVRIIIIIIIINIVDHTSPALCTPITPGSDGMARSAAA